MGRLRFEKPALTYWVISGSYHLLGPGLFSSRLPFLLAGCLVLGLTGLLARRLVADPAVVWLGPLLLAANIQMGAISIRSTPDMLQCLFLLLSVYGFSGVLFLGQRGWHTHGLAYLGAGLAGATKGSLALIATLFPFLLVALRRREWPRLRTLLHPGWMVAGASVTLTWFALAYFEHGETVLRAFVRDQTAAHTEGSWLLVASNLIVYPFAVIRHFFPWSILLLVACLVHRDILVRFAREHRRMLWFGLGWFGLLFLIFSLGPVRRTRYLLPTYPLLAILVGAALNHYLADRSAARWLSRLSRAFLAVGAIAGGLLLVAGLRLGPELMAAGGVLLFTGIALGWAGRRMTPVASFALPAWLWMIALGVVTNLIQPAFNPSPVPVMVLALESIPAGTAPIGVVGAHESIAAQLRLATGGRLELRTLPAETSSLDLNQFEALLVFDEQIEFLREKGWTLEPCGVSHGRRSSRDVLRLLRTGDRAAFDAAAARQHYPRPDGSMGRGRCGAVAGWLRDPRRRRAGRGRRPRSAELHGVVGQDTAGGGDMTVLDIGDGPAAGFDGGEEIEHMPAGGGGGVEFDVLLRSRLRGISPVRRGTRSGSV
jgi:hypothetical protein